LRLTALEPIRRLAALIALLRLRQCHHGVRAPHVCNGSSRARTPAWSVTEGGRFETFANVATRPPAVIHGCLLSCIRALAIPRGASLLWGQVRDASRTGVTVERARLSSFSTVG
jgi:hypothetical protein